MKTGDSERALELEFKRRWVVSGRLFHIHPYFIFFLLFLWDRMKTKIMNTNASAGKALEPESAYLTLMQKVQNLSKGKCIISARSSQSYKK